MQKDTGRAPHLDALLAELRGTLVRQLWLHGLGTTLLATAAWLVFCFTADWMLHLPLLIRVLHAGVLVALPIWLMRREFVLHMRRLPDRAGLAQLIERHHPETKDLFVSAVQLAPQLAQGDARRDELIRRVLQEAEARSRSIELAPVLARRGPQRRALSGLVAGLLVVVGMANVPTLTGIFFERLLGGGQAWPQRTHLRLEIPAVGEQVQVEQVGDEIHLRVARGSDVPVLVHADGVVPDEVILHFDSGHRVVLTSGGSPLFRTRLPAVQEDTSFHATGGDDDDGDPIVRLTVLRPPDVSGIAVSIQPPAYSGLPARIEEGGDVEVLEGSELIVYVLPDPSNATGIARLLPEDVVHALTPAAFPFALGQSALGPAADGAAASEAPAQQGLSFALQAQASARYRFELIDESGLPNPDPGLYAIEVAEDQRPELVLVSPSRAEVDVVIGGALALRVRVFDDFGVASLRWSTRATAEAEATLASHALELRPETIEPGASRAQRVSLSTHTRLEVSEFFGLAPGAEAADGFGDGASLVLQLEAQDNKQPQPNSSLSAPVRLRVVTRDEFLRRLQDTLARSGEMAARLARLEEQRLLRSQELLAALSGEEAEAGNGSEIGLLLSGLRRVQGDAGALTRDLSSVTEGLLYARADDRAGKLLDLLDTELARVVDKSFHVQPWRSLVDAYARGELGRAGLAGQLVEIVGLALLISEDASVAAVSSLEAVSASRSPAEMRTALALSIEHQGRAMEATTRLLERLAEWDNLNSILTLTRDILNRQKNLTERTRRHAKDN